MSDASLTEIGRGLRWEDWEWNLDSLNNTCMQAYKWLECKSRHKYPLETME